MMSKYKLALFSLMLLLALPIANAGPLTDAFRGGLADISDFLRSAQYEPYVTALNFFFFSILFIAIYMVGAKQAFKEMKRPEKTIVVLLGLMTAFLLVLAGFSVTLFLPFMNWIVLILVFLAIWWLLGRGETRLAKSKIWRFILALLLTLLLLALFQLFYDITSFFNFCDLKYFNWLIFILSFLIWMFVLSKAIKNVVLRLIVALLLALIIFFFLTTICGYVSLPEVSSISTAAPAKGAGALAGYFQSLWQNLGTINYGEYVPGVPEWLRSWFGSPPPTATTPSAGTLPRVTTPSVGGGATTGGVAPAPTPPATPPAITESLVGQVFGLRPQDYTSQANYDAAVRGTLGQTKTIGPNEYFVEEENGKPVLKRDDFWSNPTIQNKEQDPVIKNFIDSGTAAPSTGAPPSTTPSAPTTPTPTPAPTPTPPAPPAPPSGAAQKPPSIRGSAMGRLLDVDPSGFTSQSAYDNAVRNEISNNEGNEIEAGDNTYIIRNGRLERKKWWADWFSHRLNEGVADPETHEQLKIDLNNKDIERGKKSSSVLSENLQVQHAGIADPFIDNPWLLLLLVPLLLLYSLFKRRSEKQAKATIDIQIDETITKKKKIVENLRRIIEERDRVLKSADLKVAHMKELKEKGIVYLWKKIKEVEKAGEEFEESAHLELKLIGLLKQLLHVERDILERTTVWKEAFLKRQRERTRSEERRAVKSIVDNLAELENLIMHKAEANRQAGIVYRIAVCFDAEKTEYIIGMELKDLLQEKHIRQLIEDKLKKVKEDERKLERYSEFEHGTIRNLLSDIERQIEIMTDLKKRIDSIKLQQNIPPPKRWERLVEEINNAIGESKEDTAVVEVHPQELADYLKYIVLSVGFKKWLLNLQLNIQVIGLEAKISNESLELKGTISSVAGNGDFNVVLANSNGRLAVMSANVNLPYAARAYSGRFELILKNLVYITTNELDKKIDSRWKITNIQIKIVTVQIKDGREIKEGRLAIEARKKAIYTGGVKIAHRDLEVKEEALREILRKL